jgi:hypothetical protein
VKITKSKLKKIIREAIDDVAGDDFYIKQRRDYEEMQKTMEYQGAVQFIDPNHVPPTKVRREHPALWTLLGQAWAIMAPHNPSHNEAFNITANTSTSREYQMEKWGLDDREKQILMNAYEQSQAISKATPVADRGYGTKRYQGD